MLHKQEKNPAHLSKLQSQYTNLRAVNISRKPEIHYRISCYFSLSKLSKFAHLQSHILKSNINKALKDPTILKELLWSRKKSMYSNNMKCLYRFGIKIAFFHFHQSVLYEIGSSYIKIAICANFRYLTALSWFSANPFLLKIIDLCNKSEIPLYLIVIINFSNKYTARLHALCTAAIDAMTFQCPLHSFSSRAFLRRWCILAHWNETGWPFTMFQWNRTCSDCCIINYPLEILFHVE